jgi:putative transcriptional regulator
MIKWKLTEVMARHRIKAKDLAIDMGYTAASVSTLRKGSMPRLREETLDRLLISLNRMAEEKVEVSDLIQWKD